MSQQGEMHADSHGDTSGSIQGPRDEQMGESMPKSGPGGGRLTQDAASSAVGSEARRSQLLVPRRRDASTSAPPSRIPTRASTMKRRSPTPPRARTRLETQTEAVLQSASALH